MTSQMQPSLRETSLSGTHPLKNKTKWKKKQKQAKAHSSPPSPLPSLLTLMCLLSWNVEMTLTFVVGIGCLCCSLTCSWDRNELLCSLLSFVLQPPSSSLQLLLKLLRLMKVNGSGCPLLLLFTAIDRGLCWVFIHLAGAWIECVGCLG